MNLLSKYLVIGCLAGLLFLPFLGRVHLFDWDEINFAESAREMLVTKNYGLVQIDYKPFWEKPPLFIWLQAASMRVFGVNDFAARLPDALTGIITLLVLMACGRRVGGDRLGWLWVMAYAGSWLPFLYFKSGIIDPVFNLFIFCSVWKLSRIPFSPIPFRKAIWSGIFLGFAVLTKGPVAVLVAALVMLVWIVWKRGKSAIRWAHMAVVALITAGITCAWFGYIAAVSGWGLIRDFILYQIRLFSTPDSTHGGPFFYHWYVLLLGCFPASVFLLSWLGKGPGKDTERQKDFRRWMWALFWVVLLLFSIVRTKIIHYSSLCYFPLTFLAAWRLQVLLETPGGIRRWVVGLLGLMGILIGLCLGLLPVLALHPAWLAGHIADPFARANLQASVAWTLGDCLPGIIYALLILVSCSLLWRKRIRRGLIVLLISQLAMMEWVVVLFVPKVEDYTQQAAISFYQSLQGKDVYVHPLGYKSYAQLFYARVMPQTNPAHDDENWLLNGKLDKPAYFVCKITSAAHFEANPNLEVIGSKNGFVFLRRLP